MIIFVQSLSHKLHFPKVLRDFIFAKWKLLRIIKMKVLFDRGILMMFGNTQFKSNLSSHSCFLELNAM